MGKRNIKFYAHSQRISDWIYMDPCCFIPSIYTYSLNTYTNGKKYLYTRYIEIIFLWFNIGVQWDFGKLMI